VLFETHFQNNNELFEGYTANYVKVVAKSHSDISSAILKVKITEAKDEYLIGEIID